MGALESIKGSKVNAKGVKVQSKLDAAGGQLMEVFKNYCCPVNFQTAQESSPKPFRIGLRGFIFKKQAP